MAKPTKHEPGFEFSSKGIVNLCPDLPLYFRNMLVDQLEWAWDESEDFEVEIEVPMQEKPYYYLLRVVVDPAVKKVSIERRIP